MHVVSVIILNFLFEFIPSNAYVLHAHRIADYREQDNLDLETVTRLGHMVTEYESEIAMLRARVVKFDEERARDQAEMERLKSEIERLRTVR